MTQKIYDTAVVGAGAAGLMAAIQCADQGLSVLLLDSQKRIGAKILMSGGTRCNVTNEQVTERDFSGETPVKIRHILSAFPPGKSLAFFKKIGVNLIQEDGGKYFPSTHSARTVLEALTKEIKRLSVELLTERKVKKIIPDSAGFLIETSLGTYAAKTCVLTTGGLSYPSTGSDGSGYGVAQSLGHSLIPTIPALTPFRADQEIWKKLAGLALPVSLTLWSEGKKKAETAGPLLFTHFGFSGPSVLDISRHWLRHCEKPKTEIRANFLPALDENNFLQELEALRKKSSQGTLKNYLQDLLPNRFAEVLLKECAIPFERKIAEIKNQEKSVLVKYLFAYPLPVTGVWGYQKAEVTAGGIPLNEVHTATLESLKQPGIFFAGEILDADGRIGGFNFQWAWASGFVAAQGVLKKVKTQVNAE